MHRLIRSIRRCWLVWRLTYRTLFVIRFPIFMASFSILVLYTGQGQDILRYLAESENAGDIVIFAALAQLCGLITWHVSRTLFRFKVRRQPGSHLMPILVTWAPRFLAAAVPGLILIAAIIAIHISTEQAAGQHRILLLSLLTLAAGINMLATWWRRRVARLFSLLGFMAPVLTVEEELREHGLHTIHALAHSAQRFYLLTFLLSPISIIWISLSHGQLPAWMSAGAVTLLALTLATIFGSGLTYFSMRMRLPLFGFVIVSAILYSALGWNDNHRIRELPSTIAVQQQSGMQDDLDDVIWQKVWEQRFGSWQAENEPVVFIASSGGGIRAAYWTAQVLGSLSAYSPALRERIFSISGVSGGSVGAAVYTAIQQNYQAQPEADRDELAAARAILSRDLLTPILSTFLFPDIAQRFIPFPLFPNDRAAAGEHALEEYWYSAFPAPELTIEDNNPLKNSLYDIRPQPGGNVPYLILNITDLTTGQRVIAHNLTHEVSSIFSFAEPDLDYAKTLRLSTAAFLSARFPYITPSGTLDYMGGGGPRHLRLGDGGYFENSGALSTLEVVERLYIHRTRGEAGFIPVVIQIDNDPSISDNLDQEPPNLARSGPILGQLRDPLTGLTQVRSAHGYRASDALRQWVGHGSAGGLAGLVSCDMMNCPRQARGHYFHFRLYKNYIDVTGRQSKANPMPLGWLLSYQARREIECQLYDQRNVEEMRRLLALFGKTIDQDQFSERAAACHTI